MVQRGGSAGLAERGADCSGRARKAAQPVCRAGATALAPHLRGDPGAAPCLQASGRGIPVSLLGLGRVSPLSPPRGGGECLRCRPLGEGVPTVANPGRVSPRSPAQGRGFPCRRAGGASALPREGRRTVTRSWGGMSQCHRLGRASALAPVTRAGSPGHRRGPAAPGAASRRVVVSPGSNRRHASPHEVVPEVLAADVVRRFPHQRASHGCTGHRPSHFCRLPRSPQPKVSRAYPAAAYSAFAQDFLI